MSVRLCCVSLDCVIYCAFYSILFRRPFFPDTVHMAGSSDWVSSFLTTHQHTNAIQCHSRSTMPLWLPIYTHRQWLADDTTTAYHRQTEWECVQQSQQWNTILAASQQDAPAQCCEDVPRQCCSAVHRQPPPQASACRYLFVWLCQ